jgi:hypothetical protein
MIDLQKEPDWTSVHLASTTRCLDGYHGLICYPTPTTLREGSDELAEDNDRIAQVPQGVKTRR